MPLVAHWTTRRSIAIATAAILVSLLLAACAAPMTDFDRAVAAYQEKRYDVALPLMTKEAKAGNRGKPNIRVTSRHLGEFDGRRPPPGRRFP